VAAAKLTGLHVVGGVATLNLNVFVVLVPLLAKALTVIGYVPAGRALATCTTPVPGSPSSLPLKFVRVETLIVIVFVGVASGVIVALLLSEIDAPGQFPKIGSELCPPSGGAAVADTSNAAIIAPCRRDFFISNFLEEDPRSALTSGYFRRRGTEIS
jgi:hypothetical protein